VKRATSRLHSFVIALNIDMVTSSCLSKVLAYGNISVIFMNAYALALAFPDFAFLASVLVRFSSSRPNLASLPDDSTYYIL
jgi:hypothetical protein